MRTTGVTRLLDFVRHLIVFAVAGAVLYLSWAKVDRLAPAILAIPVYFGSRVFADFLTLPLYLLTSENRATSKILKAVEKGDFSTALRTLKAHEKWRAEPLHDGPKIASAEVDAGRVKPVPVRDSRLVPSPG